MDQNGVITMYEVMYTPLMNFGGTLESNSSIMLEPARSVNLTGLEEYVNYSISVRAYTSVGVGPYSDNETVWPEEEGTSCNNTILSIFCSSRTKY